MLKYLIIGLLLSLGWYIGKFIVINTEIAIHNHIDRAKHKRNSDAKGKHIEYQRYKGTKMGF